jgi:Tfp pilus assembly protein PilO
MKRLLTQIGFAGLASIVLLAAALAFSGFVVKPLQEKNQLLKETAGRQARKPDASQSGDKVAAVYEFLQKEEDTTDWLAKLHGIGVATGVKLKSANYRTQRTEGRIVRYEIVLPASGSYAQIRDFLKRSLAEIPVLSVDSLSLKREDRGGAIQAEMRLTLHMVKS